MHSLPVVAALDSSVHAPFASELDHSELVFWLFVVFSSLISGSSVSSPFTAVGAKQHKNEP